MTEELYCTHCNRGIESADYIDQGDQIFCCGDCEEVYWRQHNDR